jgi:PMC2NT (NUC016) domain
MDHCFALWQDLDTFSERVLLLTNKLLNLAATVDQSLVKGKGKLASQDDVVDNFHSLVVDSMDQLLEKTVSLSFNDVPFLFNLRKYIGFMSRRFSGEKQVIL